MIFDWNIYIKNICLTTLKLYFTKFDYEINTTTIILPKKTVDQNNKGLKTPEILINLYNKENRDMYLLIFLKLL